MFHDALVPFAERRIIKMKLLIADDEDIIRRGLTGLDWETVGITEVRSVENGMDALQCVPRW